MNICVDKLHSGKMNQKTPTETSQTTCSIIHFSAVHLYVQYVPNCPFFTKTQLNTVLHSFQNCNSIQCIFATFWQSYICLWKSGLNCSSGLKHFYGCCVYFVFALCTAAVLQTDTHRCVEGIVYIGEDINKQINCWMHLLLSAISNKQLSALTGTLFIQLLLSPNKMHILKSLIIYCALLVHAHITQANKRKLIEYL